MEQREGRKTEWTKRKRRRTEKTKIVR